ncbi:MAG: 5-methyltetrahydropteroyltriglutamate--homocysteine S-methyltransferase, partial [Phenylobacterium sp.]|uniref:5-methyltetrahydropteroyltriglutamate-- homocysteine S-methyltransferase n=1 Tax=Phenylobacterium sp. TaxID=1871053 RepID=UPI0027291F7C
MPTAQPVLVANLGFPRIGPRRQLKTALERFWSGRLEQAGLLQTAADLRREAWARQAELGVDILPSNDFSLYDQVLDATLMVGAVPPRFAGAQGLELYFAMARGARSGEQETGCCGQDAVACEMTKWFDTNYHYLAPEVVAGQVFALSSTKAVDEFLEARALGRHTRPVLIGPVTWLKLAKAKDGSDPRDLLEGLLPVYGEILRQLAAAGADWVQMDEPALALDLEPADWAMFERAYDSLTQAAPGLKLMLTPYFAALDDNLDLALSLPVAGLHLDLVRGPGDLDRALAEARPDLVLSLGVVDGRNIWRADLSALLDRLEPVAATGRPLVLAPSCSLLHAPIDLAVETKLDPEVAGWLAFAVQKLEELAILARALNEGRAAVAEALAASDAAQAARQASPKVRDLAVQARMATVTPEMTRRAAPVAERLALQAQVLNLPAYPTTTIGSFPQTTAVRKARADQAGGRLEPGAYQAFLEDETRMAIRWQESVGLDVLVHGEFERNDMVQYFGEQLSGFAFTDHAWVQSYGSRCVRPPIIYGDVARPRPMTVDWWRYAQSLTVRPVKGMLTGPVTILQWSFVRDDIPRQETCRQIALAIRDEGADLERAGAA